MKLVKTLFFSHLAALAFGLGGLLIALPHPELWQNSTFAVQVFQFGISYAGSLHIVLGAAAVLLFGLTIIGVRKTLIFFVVATTIPLGMELLGTSTGFPFGPYAYTGFLGFKIAGLVPYSIPLSWFYMGFTSYILASSIAARWGQRHQTAWSLILGVYFLTVWDLSLDPAMASQSLPIHFWIWQRGGAYYGMPISNLVGWSLTGLIYIGLSRLLWREELDTRRGAQWLPFGIYVANTLFAIALNLSAGLWIPALMAVALGLIPASLALRGTGTPLFASTVGKTSMAKRISLSSMYLGSRMLTRRKLQVMIEGLDYVPRSGPVLIVARHFHHLYDGCALLNALPRKLHILVALDWVQKRWLRGLMEWACALVEWPVMLRAERLGENAADVMPDKRSAYTRSESLRYLRRATRDAIQLLRGGETLVVFPEAYPNIDPAFTPKNDGVDFLPFRTGFARLSEMAERDGHTQVAIIPAGLTYAQENGRWQVTLRFGPPLFRRDYAGECQLARALEEQVRALSHYVSNQTEEAIHS